MSEATFRSSLRQTIRGLWSRAITEAQFDRAMTTALRLELGRAWVEGAIECGIAADELTEEEETAKTAFIREQETFIGGFGEAIQEANNRDSRTIFPLFNRAKLWLDRYPEAKANGHAMACANEKTEFLFGPTKEHCSTCSGLVHRVYRNSVWVKHNAVPPHNWNFVCRGGCKCRLQPTSKPITRGRFPVGLLR